MRIGRRDLAVRMMKLSGKYLIYEGEMYFDFFFLLKKPDNRVQNDRELSLKRMTNSFGRKRKFGMHKNKCQNEMNMSGIIVKGYVKLYGNSIFFH